MDCIKQSTSVTKIIGPFVDDTDAKTPKTDLSITQSDIRLSKNGGDFASSDNDAGASHKENGYYAVPLNAQDVDTVGTLDVCINMTGALPVWKTYAVRPASVWNALMGIDLLSVNGMSDVKEDTEAIITLLGELSIGEAPTVEEIDAELTEKHGSGSWTSSNTGSGTVYVNHTTLNDSGTDMYYQLSNGAGIVGASVIAFVKSEYDNGLRESNGETITIAGGAWKDSLKLFSGVQYVIEFYRSDYNIATTTVTPSA